MSAYTTPLYDAQVATPLTKQKPHTFMGRVRVAAGKVDSFAGGGGAGDTIALCKLPAGSRVVNGFILAEAGLMALGTMKIGDGTTDDKFMAATDITAGGRFDFPTKVEYSSIMTENAAEVTVTCTTVTDALVTAKDFGFCIFYVVD